MNWVIYLSSFKCQLLRVWKNKYVLKFIFQLKEKIEWENVFNFFVCESQFGRVIDH